MADIHIKKWSSELQRVLFEAEDYTRFSKNFADMLAAKSFIVPQELAFTSSDDDYSRPLTPGTTVDTGIEIALSGIVVDPKYITLPEQWELSFEKRSALTSQMGKTLQDRAKQKVVHGWLNTSDLTNNIVWTSGAATASKPADATGTRKKLLYADILDATEKLDVQNVQEDGRVLLVNPQMYKDIKTWSEFDPSPTISTELIKRGVVGMIDNIQVVKANMSNILMNASGGTATLATFGATGATYSFAGMVFHPDYVCRAVGSTKMYVQLDSPTYTSDVLSATQRIGGGLLRADYKGFVTLVQTIG